VIRVFERQLLGQGIGTKTGAFALDKPQSNINCALPKTVVMTRMGYATPLLRRVCRSAALAAADHPPDHLFRHPPNIALRSHAYRRPVSELVSAKNSGDQRGRRQPMGRRKNLAGAETPPSGPFRLCYIPDRTAVDSKKPSLVLRTRRGHKGLKRTRCFLLSP
jgi:hypothetical protein